MSEQTAELLALLLVLVLVLLLLLLVLQPVTSTPVTTHAAASRLPNALCRTMTPLLIARQARRPARQLGSPMKHPALRARTHHPRRANACRHAAVSRAPESLRLLSPNDSRSA